MAPESYRTENGQASQSLDKRIDSLTESYARAKTAYDESLGILRTKREELEAAAKDLNAIGINPELPDEDPALEERVQENNAVTQLKKRLPIEKVYPVSLGDFRIGMKASNNPYTMAGIYTTLHSVDIDGENSHYINVDAGITLVVEAKYHLITIPQRGTSVQVTGVGISPKTTPEEGVKK
ncbi:TPA: fimbrillin family protein [Candidatus Woesearchaeota archaeon]|nr:fimbrillin family protein [Candidatus Woesearchaeota archaeon]